MSLPPHIELAHEMSNAFADTARSILEEAATPARKEAVAPAYLMLAAFSRAMALAEQRMLENMVRDAV